jgi:hypothetical protein
MLHAARQLPSWLTYNVSLRTMPELSIVYVLTNPAMPGLVKIGVTEQAEADTRIAQLYTTGVPVPFEITYAAKVEDGLEVERALHTAFAPQRINPKREFFKIDPEQAIVILKLLRVEDATQELAGEVDEVDAESVAAGRELRKRRPNLNFEEMGIPVGSILHHTQSDATVTVVGPKKVKLGEDEMSITAATRAISDTDYDRPPGMYWTFQGRLLRKIYIETYEEE